MPPKPKSTQNARDTGKSLAFGSTRGRFDEKPSTSTVTTRRRRSSATNVNTSEDTSNKELPPVDNATKESVISALSPQSNSYSSKTSSSTSTLGSPLNFADLALSPVRMPGVSYDTYDSNGTIRMHYDDAEDDESSASNDSLSLSSMLDKVANVVNTSFSNLTSSNADESEDSDLVDTITQVNTHVNKRSASVLPETIDDVDADDEKDKIRLQAKLEHILKDHIENRIASPQRQRNAVSSPMLKKYEQYGIPSVTMGTPMSSYYNAYTSRTPVTIVQNNSDDDDMYSPPHMKSPDKRSASMGRAGQAKKRKTGANKIFMMTSVLISVLVCSYFVFPYMFNIVSGGYSAYAYPASSSIGKTDELAYNPTEWTATLLILEEAQKLYTIPNNPTAHKSANTLIDRAKMRITGLQSGYRNLYEITNALEHEKKQYIASVTALEQDVIVLKSQVEQERITCGKEQSQLLANHMSQLKQLQDSHNCPICSQDVELQLRYDSTVKLLEKCTKDGQEKDLTKSQLMEEVKKSLVSIQECKQELVEVKSVSNAGLEECTSAIDTYKRKQDELDAMLKNSSEEKTSMMQRNDQLQQELNTLQTQMKERTCPECPECTKCDTCPEPVKCETCPECTKCDTCSEPTVCPEPVKCDTCPEPVKCETCPEPTVCPAVAPVPVSATLEADFAKSKKELLDCKETAMQLDIKLGIVQEELDKVQENCENATTGSSSNSTDTNIVICPTCPVCDASGTSASPQAATMKPNIILDCDEDDDECWEQQELTEKQSITPPTTTQPTPSGLDILGTSVPNAFTNTGVNNNNNTDASTAAAAAAACEDTETRLHACMEQSSNLQTQVTTCIEESSLLHQQISNLTTTLANTPTSTPTPTPTTCEPSEPVEQPPCPEVSCAYEDVLTTCNNMASTTVPAQYGQLMGVLSKKIASLTKSTEDAYEYIHTQLAKKQTSSSGSNEIDMTSIHDPIDHFIKTTMSNITSQTIYYIIACMIACLDMVIVYTFTPSSMLARLFVMCTWMIVGMYCLVLNNLTTSALSLTNAAVTLTFVLTRK